MNVMPNDKETLLIRAATGDGEAALAAWRTWRATVDFEDVKGESYRVVPLLYRNLSRLRVPAQELTRYASVYRHNWAANGLAFKAGAQGLAQLHAAGIKTLLLKGAALAALHYRDVGVRSMADVDVLVPHAQALAAAEVLARHGWVPWPRGTRVDQDFIAANNSVGFEDAKGRQIDLHWYVTREARTRGVDDALWAAAVPVELEGVPTLALGPTDLLYNVLAHGYMTFAEHIRWAVDVAVVVRGGHVDWERLTRLAIERRFVLQTHALLSWTRDVLAVPVPESVLERLAKAKVPLIDRLEYAHARAEDRYTLDKVILRHWCWYRRATEARGLGLVAGFPRYLARHFGAAELRDLPGILRDRGIRRWKRHRGDGSDI